MKYLLIVVVLFLVAFKVVSSHENCRAAKYKGLYVFCDSQPLDSYQVIGSDELKNRYFRKQGNGKALYNAIRNDLIDKVRVDYPDADGILIDATEMTCDVIKFR